VAPLALRTHVGGAPGRNSPRKLLQNIFKVKVGKVYTTAVIFPSFSSALPPRPSTATLTTQTIKKNIFKVKVGKVYTTAVIFPSFSSALPPRPSTATLSTPPQL
jgi:hypothetical protein